MQLKENKMQIAIRYLIKFQLVFLFSVISCVRMGSIAKPTPTKISAGIFVDQNNLSTIHDGKSWETAYLTIEDGIKDALASGKKIYVTSGNYENNYINLIGRSNIHLLGGYKAGDLFLKDHSKFGDGDLTIFQKGKDQTSMIEIRDGAHDITFDGFIFEDGPSAFRIDGQNGLVHDITIKNGQVKNCKSAIDGVGGGMIINKAENITISNMAFVENVSDGGRGGAIFIADAINVQINGSLFKANTAGKTGGSIMVHDNSTVKISDCKFISNSAPRGSAIYFGDASGVGINYQNKLLIGPNVSFINNKAFVTESATVHAQLDGSKLSLVKKSGPQLVFGKNLVVSNNMTNEALGLFLFVGFKPALASSIQADWEDLYVDGTAAGLNLGDRSLVRMINSEYW